MMDNQTNNLNASPDPPLEERLLQQYVDGRLDPRGQHQVADRLKKDPEARRKLDALREEERLIIGALEKLSEPPVKVAEKVMTVLYAEHNRRMNILRARRFRNRLISIVSAAALLLIAVMTMQPREPSGQYASGSGVTVQRSEHDRFPLMKGGRFFAGDHLITNKGQFASLILSDGSTVFLSEHSILKIEECEGNTWVAELKAGRVGVHTSADTIRSVLKVKGEEIQAKGEFHYDLWLPKLHSANWPQWCEAWSRNDGAVAVESESADSVCLVVRRGLVRAVNWSRSLDWEVAAGEMVILGGSQNERPRKVAPMPRAIEEYWFKANGSSPGDRAWLRIFDLVEWKDLGSRMGLFEDLPRGDATTSDMKKAFVLLEKANETIEPLDRARQLGEGLQALRSASEVLVLSDSRRLRARVIQGLVDFEKARSILGANSPEAWERARGSFKDAMVAFEEALTGEFENAEPEGNRLPGLAQVPAPQIEISRRLRDYSPDEQASLLAAFYKPWAMFHFARLSTKASDFGSPFENGASAERDFAAVHEKLGFSVEVLAVRYGWALSLELAGKREDAVGKLRDLAGTSTAGVSEQVRPLMEGLRQAALVKLADIFAATGRKEELAEIASIFKLNYPLQEKTKAGKAIQDAILRSGNAVKN